MKKLLAFGALMAFTSCGGDDYDERADRTAYDRDTVATTTRTGTSTDEYGSGRYGFDTVGSSGLNDTTSISNTTTLRTGTASGTLNNKTTTGTTRSTSVATKSSSVRNTNNITAGKSQTSSGTMSGADTRVSSNTSGSSSTYNNNNTGSTGSTTTSGTVSGTSSGTTTGTNPGSTTGNTTYNSRTTTGMTLQPETFMIYGPSDVRWQTGVSNIPNNIKVAVLAGDENLSQSYTTGTKKGTVSGSTPGTTTTGMSGTNTSGTMGFDHKLYTVRLQLPADFIWQPNSFSGDQHITVISGNFQVAEGNQFNKANLKTVTDDGFVIIPANTHFFGYSTSGAVIQVSGMGPVEFNFAGVNKTTIRRTGTNTDDGINEDLDDNQVDDEDDLNTEPDGSEVEPEF